MYLNVENKLDKSVGTSVRNLYFILARDEWSIDKREKNIFHLFIPLLTLILHSPSVFTGHLLCASLVLCCMQGRYTWCLPLRNKHLLGRQADMKAITVCMRSDGTVILQDVYQEHILRDVELPENFLQK